MGNRVEDLPRSSEATSRSGTSTRSGPWAASLTEGAGKPWRRREGDNPSGLGAGMRKRPCAADSRAAVVVVVVAAAAAAVEEDTEIRRRPIHLRRRNFRVRRGRSCLEEGEREPSR